MPARRAWRRRPPLVASRTRAAPSASYSARGCSFRWRAPCLARVHSGRAGQAPQSAGRNVTETWAAAGGGEGAGGVGRAGVVDPPAPGRGELALRAAHPLRVPVDLEAADRVAA